MVANNNVDRILVDNVHLVDIMYYQVFLKMGVKVSDVKPSPNPVCGFTRDSVSPIGFISPPMTLGDYP